MRDGAERGNGATVFPLCGPQPIRVILRESRDLGASTGYRATSRRWWYLPYAVVDLPADIGGLEQALIAWNHTYETVLPHQALGYQTPDQFYRRWLATTPMERRGCPKCPDPIHIQSIQYDTLPVRQALGAACTKR